MSINYGSIGSIMGHELTHGFDDSGREYDTDVLTFNIVSGTEIIQPLRNRILTMDENNIQTVQLEIVAEK